MFKVSWLDLIFVKRIENHTPMKNLNLTLFFLSFSMLSIGQVWSWSNSINQTIIESESDADGNRYVLFDSSLSKYSPNGTQEWSCATNGTIKALDVSLNGDVAIAGNFSGATDLDFTSGSSVSTALGNRDMFFARYSPSGNFLYAKTIPGNLDEAVWDIALGSNLEVILSCAIISSFDTVMASSNMSDQITNINPVNAALAAGPKFLLLKYDASNNLLLKQEQSAFGVCANVHPPTIKTDRFDNIYLSYYGCSSTSSMMRYKIEKRNSSGSLLWNIELSTNSAIWSSFDGSSPVNHTVEEVEIDDDGSIHIISDLTYEMRPDPNNSQFVLYHNTSGGGYSGKHASFVSKYDLNGNHIWSHKIADYTNTIGNSCVLNYYYAHDLEVDYGKVFIGGKFSKSLDFNPDPQVENGLTFYNDNCVNNTHDAFLAVYDAVDGSFLDIFQYAGPQDDYLIDLCSDKIGGLFAMGHGGDTLDIDPTANAQVIDGNFNSYYSICTPPNTVSAAISTDTICEGNAVSLSASGADSYYWNVALDSVGAYVPESSKVFQVKGVDTNGCYAWSEVYVTVLQPIADTFNVTICQGDEYVFGGQNLTNSGFSTLVYTSALGCDSLSTVQLDVLPPAFSSYSIQLCQGDSTLINGTYETQTGLYYEQYQNANGCDSMVAIALQVLKPITKYFTHQICEGDSLLIGNEYQTAAGVYIDVFSGSNGCDSLIYETTLNVQSVDISLQTSGYTISANPFNDTYQWIDCSTNQPIVGETFAQFTASNSGSFALETSKNGCSDFSECVSITVVGVEELTGSKISVFPNPTRESFVLKGAINSTLIIQSLTGETLFQSAVTEDETLITTNQFAQGTYLIYVISEHYSKTLKLVVVE